MQVLDYSAGFPGAGSIKAAGYVGAVRYIGFPDRRKCTTASELADFTARGLGMALVYEDHADDWRGGFSAGAAAARRARTHADSIGFPDDRPIYMAIDRDVVTEAEFLTAVSYLRGAGTVLGADLTGVYGEHDMCARAAQVDSNGVPAAAWFWQCRAWSGTPPRMFAGRHLYQDVGYVYVGGVACDFNVVSQEDWGHHLEESMSQLTGRQAEMLEQLYSALSKPYLQNGVDVGDVLARLGRLFPDLDTAAMAQWGTLNPITLTNGVVSSYSLLFKNVWPLLQVLAGQLDDIAAAVEEGRQDDAKALVSTMRSTLGDALEIPTLSSFVTALDPGVSDSNPELIGSVEVPDQRVGGAE